MSNQFTNIVHERAEPGTGRDCSRCGEHLTKASFNQYGNQCKLCYNIRYHRDKMNLRSNLAWGEPLKVRTYTPTLINGVWINKPGEKVSGT